MSDKISDKPLAGEAFSRSSTVSLTTIPAGGSYSIGQYGERFYFINATGSVDVKTNLTSFKPYRKGTGELFSPEMRFHRLELRNNNAFPITIALWVGFGEYIDTTAEVVEAFSKVKGWNASSIAGSTTITFSGDANGDLIQRKALIVSNLDLASTLTIRDENNNRCAVVFPGTTVTLPISGIVKVQNETGLAITAYISEIWYSYNV